MRFFREALASVQSQTSPHWDLCIVVDDDDPQSHRAILGALREHGCSDDPRIAVVVNEGRLITGAFNTGMRRAATPFACALHCDDLLDRQAIAVVTRSIAAYPHVQYFHSSRRYIDEQGRPVSAIRKAVSSFALVDFKEWGPVKSLHSWSVDAALAIGGMDESLGLHGADDYEFSWRMAEAGYVFKAIPECLYHYRDHREHYRLTTHVPLDTQLRELEKIWRKHGLSEQDIAEQIRKRTPAYLKQALYADDADREMKERDGYDIRAGWRQRY